MSGEKPTMDAIVQIRNDAMDAHEALHELEYPGEGPLNDADSHLDFAIQALNDWIDKHEEDPPEPAEKEAATV